MTPDAKVERPAFSGRFILSVLFLSLILSFSVPIRTAAAGGSRPSTSGTSAAPPPFANGERFVYHIFWFSILAGTAVLEVDRSMTSDGRPGFRFAAAAQSGPLVTRFYPVDNRVESQVDAATLLPQRMTFRRREGRRKHDFEYAFHHAAGTVTAAKDGRTDVLAIPNDSQDAISCLYYVRSVLPMTPGAALVLNVHHDKKNYKLEVRVEALEQVEGPWGAVETARVVAIMPFQGIFLNQGNIRVWFTTDERRIPVMMKAKVLIGSVVAKLVNGFGLSTVSLPPSP